MRYSFKFAPTTLKSMHAFGTIGVSNGRIVIDERSLLSISFGSKVQSRPSLVASTFCQPNECKCHHFGCNWCVRVMHMVYIKYIYQASNGLGCIGDRDVYQYRSARGFTRCHRWDFGMRARSSLLAIGAYCMLMCARTPSSWPWWCGANDGIGALHSIGF